MSVQIKPEDKAGTSHSTTFDVAGYSFWKWTVTESQWALLENRSGPGFEPGKGPVQEGRFDGQTVRWANTSVKPRDTSTDR